MSASTAVKNSGPAFGNAGKKDRKPRRAGWWLPYALLAPAVVFELVIHVIPMVTGIWMFNAFQAADFTWDVQIEPAINQHAHHFFANGVAVSATTNNREAAASWAEFLTASEVAATVRVESAWELPALDAPEYFEAYLEQSPPANRAAVFQALESPVTPPVIERQNEMQDTVNNLISRVLDGELTAQEALDQAKEAIDQLIQ